MIFVPCLIFDALRLTINDTAFIPAFQQGHPGAFDAVYNHFIDPVRHFVDQLVKDQQAAEDITVLAFTRTFKRNADFVSVEKLKGFLFVTAGNAARDFLRSQRRQREAYDEMLQMHTDELEDIELAYIRTEAAQAVREAIHVIPGQPGTVLRMLYIDGKTLPEVAAEMQLAYNTVQNYRARGLELIRQHLKNNQLLSAAGLLMALALVK